MFNPITKIRGALGVLLLICGFAEPLRAQLLPITIDRDVPAKMHGSCRRPTKSTKTPSTLRPRWLAWSRSDKRQSSGAVTYDVTFSRNSHYRS